MSIFFEGIKGVTVDAAALVVLAAAAVKVLADIRRAIVEPKPVAEAGAGGGAKKKKKPKAKKRPAKKTTRKTKTKPIVDLDPSEALAYSLASVDNRVVNPSSTKTPTEKAAAKAVIRKKKKAKQAAAAAAGERQRAAAEAETGEEDEDYDSDGYQAAGRPAEKAVLRSLRRKKAVAKGAAEKGPSADVREEDEQEGNQERLRQRLDAQHGVPEPAPYGPGIISTGFNETAAIGDADDDDDLGPSTEKATAQNEFEYKCEQCHDPTCHMVHSTKHLAYIPLCEKRELLE